jgi:hypothetical protein
MPQHQHLINPYIDLEKERIVEKAKEILEGKIAEIEKAIFNVQNAANEESKSSMGDKYETGRAMAQNDRAMLEVQKGEFLNDKSVLENINFNQVSENIRPGSIVETSIGIFLLSISLGKVVLDGKTIMLISVKSPIGTLLLGKNKSDKLNLNGKLIEVLNFY